MAPDAAEGHCMLWTLGCDASTECRLVDVIPTLFGYARKVVGVQ